MPKTKRPNRFVILCQPRTGSYLLVDLLNQFSDIVCHGEIFKPKRVELKRSMQSKVQWSWQERDHYPITFINTVYGLTPNRIAGFKMFHSHHPVARQYVLETRNITKILLTRAPLDSYFSGQRARITGEWTKRSKGSASKIMDGKEPLLKFDADEYAAHEAKVKEIDRHYSTVETFSKQTFLRIHYEQVAEIEPVKLLAQLLGSQDLTANPVPTLKKQIEAPLEKLVENYDEMRNQLKMESI